MIKIGESVKYVGDNQYMKDTIGNSSGIYLGSFRNVEGIRMAELDYKESGYLPTVYVPLEHISRS